MTTVTMAVQPRTAAPRTPQSRPALSATARPTTIAHAVSPARSNGPSLVAVRDGLWRVVDRSGAVLGHIERETHADGERYLARRLVMPTRRIDLGAFWRIDDAADCFR
ncbi:hypothetical protein [Cryobacterium sp. N22]|uniref:hypothetical protein n=1 Tax=Cryobacterium sp. N22 TaxID=2048290 RepID=UPI000CE462CF|nr:hypothetical protein [Cryobacterium sp. N22]